MPNTQTHWHYKYIKTKFPTQIHILFLEKLYWTDTERNFKQKYETEQLQNTADLRPDFCLWYLSTNALLLLQGWSNYTLQVPDYLRQNNALHRWVPAFCLSFLGLILKELHQKKMTGHY